MKRANADDDVAACSRKTQHIATKPELQSMLFDVVVSISAMLPITDVHRMGCTCRRLRAQTKAILRGEGGVDVLVAMMKRAPTLPFDEYVDQLKLCQFLDRHDDLVRFTLMGMPPVRMQAIVARLSAPLLHMLWTMSKGRSDAEKRVICTALQSPLFMQTDPSERTPLSRLGAVYKTNCCLMFDDYHIMYVPELVRVARAALPDQWNISRWWDSARSLLATDSANAQVYIDAIRAVIDTDVNPPQGTLAIVAQLFVLFWNAFTPERQQLLWDTIVVDAARQRKIRWNGHMPTWDLGDVYEDTHGSVTDEFTPLIENESNFALANDAWFAAVRQLRAVWNAAPQRL